MPAAARLYCIIYTKDLEMLELVSGLCRTVVKFCVLVFSFLGLDPRTPRPETIRKSFGTREAQGEEEPTGPARASWDAEGGQRGGRSRGRK
jgi:hypothetical protein